MHIRVSDVGRPVGRVFYLRTSKAVVLVWRGGLECIGILLFYIQCCSSEDTGSVISPNSGRVAQVYPLQRQPTDGFLSLSLNSSTPQSASFYTLHFITPSSLLIKRCLVSSMRPLPMLVVLQSPPACPSTHRRTSQTHPTHLYTLHLPLYYAVYHPTRP